MSLKQFKVIVLSFTIIIGCQSIGQNDVQLEFSEDTFNEYWYKGTAEITSYDLQQARYGEVHQGHAVLVFVTEPFSKSKQVKLDYPKSAGEDLQQVLKLNFTKNFNTGLYPYSMMTSVFTPIDFKKNTNTLKVTTSSQEWCGHTFTQINNRKESYDVAIRSYFESEGDENFELEKAILEDEIWNQIRINPNNLPTGIFKIIPGTMFQRLRHTKLEVTDASAFLEKQKLNGQELFCYTLKYPQYDRVLKIYFSTTFPYAIERWEETYESGWGSKAQKLTTIATKKKSIMIDYWTKNSLKDAGLRKKLDLQ